MSNWNINPKVKKVEEKEEKEKKDIYQSKDGFIRMPTLRGRTEIKALYNYIYSIPGPHSYFICGGYVRYMISTHPNPVPASDIDIYCKDQESYDELHQGLKNMDLETRFENEISLAFKRPKDPEHPFFAAPIIQIIKPLREGKVVTDGTMEEILENFDFTIARCGLPNSNEAIADADFPHDEPKRILRIKNIHCPISTTYRCIKYSKKGYWLPTTQCYRLFEDWDARDDEYRNKMAEFFTKAQSGTELTQEEINEQEALMRID